MEPAFTLGILYGCGCGFRTAQYFEQLAAYYLKSMSRVRVLISGSWVPRYARNLGTGEPMLTGGQLKPATHSVHFGESRLLLPASGDGGADPGGDAG